MARTRRFVRGWGIPLAALCWAAAVLFTSTPQASAADPVGQVQAQLAAGEFGPALARQSATQETACRESEPKDY